MALHNISRDARKPVLGFPTMSDTNRSLQLQKIDRRLKIRVYEEEVSYYPCSENKGADRLRNYYEADLRNPVFSCRGSYVHSSKTLLHDILLEAKQNTSPEPLPEYALCQINLAKLQAERSD